MSTSRVLSFQTCAALLSLAMAGCSARQVDLSTIPRPPRSPEMDAYGVFVGSWTWKAEMANATEGGQAWEGTAEWNWTLDQRCLEGRMSARSAHAEFESHGVWSRHPRSGRYIWWMFNNWGYPQQGTARYNADTRCWTMDYKSVGLDGTPSRGRYVMRVVNDDTLDWEMHEWAGRFHLVKKMEMHGQYLRRK